MNSPVQKRLIMLDLPTPPFPTTIILIVAAAKVGRKVSPCVCQHVVWHAELTVITSVRPQLVQHPFACQAVPLPECGTMGGAQSRRGRREDPFIHPLCTPPVSQRSKSEARMCKMVAPLTLKVFDESHFLVIPPPVQSESLPSSRRCFPQSQPWLSLHKGKPSPSDGTHRYPRPRPRKIPPRKLSTPPQMRSPQIENRKSVRRPKAVNLRRLTVWEGKWRAHSMGA